MVTMSLAGAENLVQAGATESFTGTVFGSSGMSRFLKTWLTPSPKFELVAKKSLLTAAVEQYLGNKFAFSYGASLAEFLPLFLTLRC